MAADLSGGLDPGLLAEVESIIGERKLIEGDYASAKEVRLQGLCRNNFQLGLWANKVAPTNARRGQPQRIARTIAIPQDEILGAYAKHVRFSAGTLRILRDVAVKWEVVGEAIAAGDEAPKASWSVYAELARSPKRFDLLDRLFTDPEFPEGWRRGRSARPGEITQDRVRLALGIKTTRQPAPTTAVEKAAKVIKELEDPDVRQAVSDYGTATKQEREAKVAAKRASRLASQAIRYADEAAKDAARKGAEQGTLHFGDVVTRLDGAAVLLAGMLRQADHIPEHMRRVLATQVANIRTYSDGLLAVFEGRQDPPKPTDPPELTA